MAFVKYASATVQSIWAPNKKTSGIKAAEQIDIPDIPDDLVFSPDNVYSVARAISARTNQNFDSFERHELLGEINDLPPHNDIYGYRTFFTNKDGGRSHIDHWNNPYLASQDPRHTPRGKLLYAWYIEDEMGDVPRISGVEDPIYKSAGADCWVKVLIQNSRKEFPLLCEAIESGLLNKVSMGTEILFSTCSICSNRARNELEFCGHASTGRGQVFGAQSSSPLVQAGLIQAGDPMFASELNTGLQFFELSWITDIQADPTAVALDRIKGEEGSSLRDLLLEKDGRNANRERIHSMASYRKKKALEEETPPDRPVSTTNTQPRVNFNIENAEALQDQDESRGNIDKDFDYNTTPDQQDGEFYPEYPFPCSALESASDANPDYPMDTTIDVEKCFNCIYNRSNKVGAVDCSFPEVVREGGSDPLPVGFADPHEADPSRNSSGFLNEDGTPISEFPNIKHPSPSPSSP